METAAGFGIAPERAANYHADRQGTRLNYEALGDAISDVRCCRPLSDDWKARIDEDFASR